MLDIEICSTGQTWLETDAASKNKIYMWKLYKYNLRRVRA